MRGKHITEPERKAIIRMIQQGHTRNAIASRFNRNPQTIKNIADDAGLPIKSRRRSEFTDDLKAQLVDLFYQNLTDEVIAESMGFHISTIGRHRSLMGLRCTREMLIERAKKKALEQSNEAPNSFQILRHHLITRSWV